LGISFRRCSLSRLGISFRRCSLSRLGISFRRCLSHPISPHSGPL
jgi:hypothetical protein